VYFSLSPEKELRSLKFGNSNFSNLYDNMYKQNENPIKKIVNTD